MSQWRVQYDTFDQPDTSKVLEIPVPNTRYYVLAAILLWKLPQTAPLGPDVNRYPESFTAEEDRRLYVKVCNSLTLTEWDSLSAEERVPFMEEVAMLGSGVMDQVTFVDKQNIGG